MTAQKIERFEEWAPGRLTHVFPDDPWVEGWLEQERLSYFKQRCLDHVK